MAEIARRYSKALLEVAVEEGKLDEYYSQAAFLLETIKADTEFLNVIMHPQITSDEKTEIFTKIFSGKINEPLIGLLCVIVAKNRESELFDILEDFINIAAETNKVTSAHVYTSVPASEEQLAKIKAILEKSLSKSVNLITHIDESLLGGLLIKADDMVFDRTIKREFSEIKSGLLKLRIENIEERSAAPLAKA